MPDFPSGSSINYCDGKLYLIGDDANEILILDRDYKRIDSKKLFNFTEKRISKKRKTDLEASTFIKIDGQDYFLIVGSASKDQREKVFLIPYSDFSLDVLQFRTINTTDFVSRLYSDNMIEVNIEGVTITPNNLLLSNRGNRKNPSNYLLVTDFDFWSSDRNVNLKIVPIQLPNSAKGIPCISELCYVDSMDVLLMTLSTEGTDNAYDDGAIGESYIGWIKNISHRLNDQALMVDQMINLTKMHSDFKNQKIEGLCVESIQDNEFILHLVSDNDDGLSTLFKVSLIINE